jgi:protein required for attachment to host cells
VEWLKETTKKHEIDRLVIFAPPRMLGVLRKIPSGQLFGQVEELEGNLMRLDAGQLAEHPMIRQLLEAAQ